AEAARAQAAREKAEAAARAKADADAKAKKLAAEKAEAARAQAAREKAEAAARAKADADAAAAARAEAAAQARIDEFNKAKNAIQMKTNRSWIRPPTSRKGLKCRIRVRLLSDGTVIEAIVISSSGDEIFDRSAENAVNKASPLPVPRDKELFAKEFRSFTFTFDPDR
ncbi:MAG: cell envelope integrity protein TolA, partial [Gammaproteobacteria bacterium]